MLRELRGGAYCSLEKSVEASWKKECLRQTETEEHCPDKDGKEEHLRKRPKDWPGGFKETWPMEGQGEVTCGKSLVGRGNMAEGGQIGRSQRASNAHWRPLDLSARHWGVGGQQLS